MCVLNCTQEPQRNTNSYVSLALSNFSIHFYHIIFDMSCKAIKKFLSIPILNPRYLLYNVRKPFIFFGGIMKNFRNYLQLHLNILLFSLTSVFSKLASIQYNRNGLHCTASLCISVAYDCQLRHLCDCLAAGYQEIFSVNCLCQQKRLPSVVADLGSDHLSRTAFPTEHSGNPDRIIWSMDGAAL